MKKFRYVWCALFCLSIAVPAMAGNKHSNDEFERELKYTQGEVNPKVNAKSNNINSLRGGLRALEERVTDLENQAPVPGPAGPPGPQGEPGLHR